MTDNPKQLLVLNEEDEQIILHQMREFRGIGTTLESALGALILGQYFGWRVLKLGKKKSIGYAITEKLGSFWAVVMGKRKVPEKGMIANKEEVNKAVDQIDKEEKK